MGSPFAGILRISPAPWVSKKLLKARARSVDDLNARCDALRNVVWQLAPDE